MIHWRSETVAFSCRWIVGSAMLTTVLSSIAMARAKHIVSRTIVFSLALSPLNPNRATCVLPSWRRSRYPGCNPGRPRRCSRLGELVVEADRERGEDRHDPDDPQGGPEDQLSDRSPHVGVGADRVVPGEVGP